MALYFYKKKIRGQRMDENEKTILGVLYFLNKEKAILVVLQSAIVGQLLKW